MHALLRAVDRVNQYVGLSVCHLYFICALITIYEVVMRYFFNAPTLWAFEVVMVVCGSCWALSGSYIAMRQGHIAITVVYGYAKGRVKWWLDLVILLVSVASAMDLHLRSIRSHASGRHQPGTQRHIVQFAGTADPQDPSVRRRAALRHSTGCQSDQTFDESGSHEVI